MTRIIVICLAAWWGWSLEESQAQSPRVEEMLREYSEAIDLELQLSRRGLSRPELLAIK